MRKSRFSEDQMVRILREADNESVPKVAKRHGVSEQTIYTWRKRYGELEVADVRRLRELEAENARLKKMVAERGLEIDVMKEIAKKKVVSVPDRRRQVAYAMARGVSQRCACRLLSVAHSALGYQSRLASRDAPVVAAMTELARQYPRYGYRRIQVFRIPPVSTAGREVRSRGCRAGWERQREVRAGLCGQGLVADGLPVPGQQFVHPGVRQLRDAGEDIGEPGLGVDVVELGGADKGVHRRGALAAACVFRSKVITECGRK